MKNCPALHCPEKIPEGIIFCPRHWAMLPPDLKKKLIKHFPLASIMIMLREQPGKNYTEYLRQAVGVLGLKERE